MLRMSQLHKNKKDINIQSTFCRMYFFINLIINYYDQEIKFGPMLQHRRHRS